MNNDILKVAVIIAIVVDLALAVVYAIANSEHLDPVVLGLFGTVAASLFAYLQGISNAAAIKAVAAQTKELQSGNRQ